MGDYTRYPQIRKSGRAGDNPTNRETLDQIVRVVMSVHASELDVKSDRFEDMNL